jgi:hypothetical protein
MTRFTVVWHQRAQDELATLWIEAADRRAVVGAAGEIDRYLAVDAESKGTPIVDVIRQLTIPPLRILFAVSEPDRMVRVLLVERP